MTHLFDETDIDSTLQVHAEAAARSVFEDFKDSREHLIRGPVENDHFNKMLSERGTTWMDAKNRDSQLAEYCWHKYSWFLHHEYRRLLVDLKDGEIQQLKLRLGNRG